MIKAKVIKLQNITDKDESRMYVRTGDIYERPSFRIVMNKSK